VIFSAYDAPIQVWEASIDGGDPELLSTDCSGIPAECMDADPAYSADGNRIAFLRATETSSAIAIRDLTSGAVTILESTQVSSSDVWLAQPSWSPDGAQIVYHKGVHDPAQDKITDSSIFIVNADGSGLHELALPSDTPWGDADWSPDGTRIVLGSYPIHGFGSGEAEVYSVRPDGTDLQQLTSLGVGSGAPSWTPDGAHIFFWGYQTFYLMDPDGGFSGLLASAEEVKAGESVRGGKDNKGRGAPTDAYRAWSDHWRQVQTEGAVRSVSPEQRKGAACQALIQASPWCR